MNKRIIAAVVAAAAFAVPAAAVAHPGAGKGQKKAAKEVVRGHGKAKKDKTVAFVFKGKFVAPGTVEVTSGNAHVRKGGFVGRLVDFELASAKLVVADTNGDQAVDVADVKDGDVVIVQARAARGTQYAAPVELGSAAGIVAHKLVDQTNGPVEDEDESAPAS